MDTVCNLPDGWTFGPTNPLPAYRERGSGTRVATLTPCSNAVRSVPRWSISLPSSRLLIFISLLLACHVTSACSHPSSVPATQTSVAPPSVAGPELQIADLHNVHHLTEKLYCGSGPEDEKQLKALAEFGIKTVISVDGAKPRADLAEKYGL